MTKYKNLDRLIKEIKALKEDEIIILVDEVLKFSEESMRKFAFRQKFEIPSSVSLVKKYDNVKKISLESSPVKPFLCDTLLKRKSIREYSEKPLTFQELSTLLVYSYGVRSFSPAYNYSNFPFRTSPSGGGLQSIEIYCVINKVEEIEQGLYHFDPIHNCLDQIFTGFCIGKLSEFCKGQEFVSNAGVVFILTMVLNRGIWKYSSIYYKIALLDAGCVAENIHLLSTAMDLGSCLIAGFNSEEVSKFIGVRDELEIPVLLISIGKK